MTSASGSLRGLPTPTRQSANDPSPGSDDSLGSIVPFPVLGSPTVVHVSKLSPEAISRCNFDDVEYVVLEPLEGGIRLRPAGIEDQVRYEQEGGVGHVTYSLAEFLDEFTDAPSNPAPTFERLAQFRRDYAKLSSTQRQRFRAAARRFVAPLGSTPLEETGAALVRELKDHPGFFELRCGLETRAVYTFGPAVRRGQPHVIWCRIGNDEVLDRPPSICYPSE
jgi:hypothetical protein